MTGIRWALLCLLLASAFPKAHTPALHALENARDYREVSPRKALTLLTEHRVFWPSLTLAQRFEWLHIQFSAAQKLAQLDTMANTLSDMVALNAQYPEAGFVSDLLNAQGIVLRRTGQLEQARLNYLCSIEQADSKMQTLRSALNLASVERNLGNYPLARQINRAALKLAKSLKADRYIASIENNLGLVYLNQQDTRQAIVHLTHALDANTRLARRTSETLSGINLLNAFVQAEQWDLYERLHPRIERLLRAYPNPAREAYLSWVNAAFRSVNGSLPSADEQATLTKQYQTLNDRGVQKLVDTLIANTPLKVEKRSATDPVLLTPVSLADLAQCNWQKYEKLGYAHILATVKAENRG